MKTKILILSLFFIVLNCKETKECTPKYSLRSAWGYDETIVPDKYKQAYSETVTNIVKAATYKLTTVDYEDVDDTITEAKKVADKLYSIEVPGLAIDTCNSFRTKSYSELTGEEKKVLIKLIGE